jgi:hypothetical protein
MLHVNGVPVCTDCDKKFNNSPPAARSEDSGSGKVPEPPAKAHSQPFGTEWRRMSGH